MGKRRQRAELPLFDLPLQSSDDEAATAEPLAEPPAEPLAEPRPAEDGQLDLVELSNPEGEDSAAADEPDERALLGDRLLGGLADLAVQLAASGLAVAAAHAMDVVVTWSDWMPFGVFALAFSFLYWVVPLAFWGQTPGMAWVGHSARAAGGEPLTFGQTFRRWLGALFTVSFAGLPLLLSLTGRSFTDRLSNSYTLAEP